MEPVVSPEPVVARATRRWVRIYTRGLPLEIGERRALEIESDLWEHLHDPGTADREVLGRTLRGIHADVWWRYRSLLAARGARQRRHDMTSTIRSRWWTPVTVGLGVLSLTAGLFTAATGSSEDAPALAVITGTTAGLAGGALVLGGLLRQRRDPVTGSRLVIGGAVLAALSEPLLIPFSLLVIIAGLWTGNLATSTGPDAPRLEMTRHSITETWWRWIVAAVPLVALGFVTLVVWEHSGFVPDDCTETNPCWEDSAAWAIWILSWFVAMVVGGIGVVLGVLHLFTRHHTRPA
jgi:hypothetical protein